MCTERVGYAKLVDMSGRSLRCRCYGVTTHGTIESFTYTSSLRRGNSIASKVVSPLGYLMDFALLSFISDDSEATKPGLNLNSDEQPCKTTYIHSVLRLAKFYRVSTKDTSECISYIW